MRNALLVLCGLMLLIAVSERAEAQFGGYGGSGFGISIGGGSSRVTFGAASGFGYGPAFGGYPGYGGFSGYSPFMQPGYGGGYPTPYGGYGGYPVYGGYPYGQPVLQGGYGFSGGYYGHHHHHRHCR